MECYIAPAIVYEGVLEVHAGSPQDLPLPGLFEG